MKNSLTRIEKKEILEILLSTGGDFAEVFMEDTVNFSQEMISCKTTKSNTSMVKGAAFRIIKGNVVVNATTTFCPKASSPLSIDGPSAKISPTLTSWPTRTIGVWLKHVPEFERANLDNVYVLVSSLAFLTKILLEST